MSAKDCDKKQVREIDGKLYQVTEMVHRKKGTRIEVFHIGGNLVTRLMKPISQSPIEHEGKN